MPEERRERSGPTDEQVRSALIRFGELVRRLDEDGRLLRALPLLMGRLGDLRRLLFEYEVRVTERLLPVEDPAEREARRIVREARQREEEMRDDWRSGWDPDAPDEPDAVG
jgi:hypothetical protein